jgi:pyruvate-formate lyase-activating enzyme
MEPLAHGTTSQAIQDDPGDLAERYNIVEIFHSVQGEGHRNGIPHVFIRFGKCNLRCEWCDTNFDEFEIMKASEILSEVMKFEMQERHLYWRRAHAQQPVALEPLAS